MTADRVIAALALVALEVGCAGLSGAQKEQPTNHKPSAAKTPPAAAPRPSLQISGSAGPETGPLAPWVSIPVLPTENIEGNFAADDVPTRTCGEVTAPGTLLRAGEMVTVFRIEAGSPGLSLAFLAPDDLHEVRTSRSIGDWGQYTDIALSGAEGVLLGAFSGTVHALSGGHTTALVASTEGWADWEVDRIWSAADTVLVARSLHSSSGVWEVLSRNGQVSTAIAIGGVRRCGQPLVNGRAVALAGKDVVLLDLAARATPEVIAGNPLDESLCVAGEGSLIAVTGRIAAAPMLALHDANGWQVVALPASGEVFEPLVHGERIVVAAPRTTVHIPDGTLLAEAGVVHVVRKLGDKWGLRERLVSRAPGPRGLFGFSVGANERALYVSELVPGITLTEDGKVKAFGEPRTCRVPWTP